MTMQSEFQFEEVTTPRKRERRTRPRRKKLSIQQQFAAYHKANPWHYELFKQFAEDRKRAGWTRYGAKSIQEAIRWHHDSQGPVDDQGFKINNNYTSRYVRMLVSERPEFRSFFETRKLTA